MSNIDTAALDYRSLTLPKIKDKIKFKKPRKPSLVEVLCAIELIIWIYQLLYDTMLVKKTDMYFVTIDIMNVAAWWDIYHKARSAKGDLHDLHQILFAIGLIILALIMSYVGALVQIFS